jgi:hypothetical protein
MLTVILIWLYVIVTTYITGFGFLTTLVSRPSMCEKKGSRGIRQYDFRFRESYIVAGIVLVTVYSEIVSLFTKVGLGANLALICVCVLIAVYYRYELLEVIADMYRILRSGGNIYVYLFVFFLMAYGASHGYMHYDSDLYHAQAIHWIEDYGIVKGLGNLHVRFAYNSAAFPLTALYSFSFLGGQSYHVMSGFFALILAWQCVDIKNVYRRGHIVISDFARLVAIYYLFTIYDEMMAPASDYFLSTIVFYIIICWLDMFVRHEKSYVPYILLSLLGFYAITIKLSAAPVILLSIIPIYRLFKNRTREKMKAFGISILFAFIIVLPFLIRNVVISGWLVYPVTFIDIFNLAWKIPKGLAAYDALEIKTFGRGFNDVATYGNMTYKEWVPLWFAGIKGINKILLMLDMISVVVYVLYFIYFIVVFAGEKSAKPAAGSKSKVFRMSNFSALRIADFLAVGGTLICCLIFWFFSAPLIRYGVVYVWLVPAVILGRMFILLCKKLDDRKKAMVVKAVTVMFMVWLLYKGINLLGEDVKRFNSAYLVKQQDYGTYETNQFMMGDEVIYYPADGDQIGYYAFPASTHDLTGEVDMMGDDLRQGFMSIIP